MEYRKIIQFNFNQKKYQLLLDNKNKYFFLEVNYDGSFSYITIEELISLHNLFKNFPNIKNAETGQEKRNNNIIKIIPKVLVKGVLIPLTAALLLTGCASNITEYLNNYYNEPTTNQTITTPKIETELSFEVIDKDEPIAVDTFWESEWLSYLYVYDADYLYKILDYESVTSDEVIQRIQNNPKISDRFKNFLTFYVNQITKKYPNADLRVLNENIKTLEVVECTKQELMLASLSVDAYGCYVGTENKIYVNKEYEYKEGTWEYQVIMHEFGHALRTGYWKNDKFDSIRVNFQGLDYNFVTLEEALNSLFTISLFEYEEKDIAYQLQSNYYKVILECMNNYSLEDYVNKSSTYFLKQLDAFTGHTNYAAVIAQIIETQYKDYHSDKIEISQDQYYPLYDYISKMYFDKYITPEMDSDEIKIIVDSLIDKIMYDVPEEYNIDIEHFYEYCNNYCLENNLSFHNIQKR